MTIRRQYSLPNCTLILDGLSDLNASNGTPDPRPLMSSLFNAECHFVGCEQPLFGGRDFLTSLVATVSNYAQEFLSGIPHPALSQTTTNLVSLVKGDRENIHHLQATLEPHSNITARSSDTPTQVDLSTVQLFDLLEAIDQFLADKRTLPDIIIPLQPISKAIAQPISTHAVPVGLGLASLVVASLIGYALPAPKVSAPNSTNPAVVNPTTPKAGSSTSSKTGKITEATQIGFLQRKLQRDLNQNWQERGQIKQAANFQVNVNQDGQIVNYQAIEQTNPAQSKLTPLAKLATKNSDPNQAIGNFNVTFSPVGAIEVKSANPLQGSMNLGKSITEPKLQTSLAEQLKTTLQKSLPSQKSIDARNLAYRVAVTKTGEIADYEPTDSRAAASEAKTPLPKLVKFNPQAAISQEPLAQYQVVFGSDGKILVTPK